MSYVISNVIVFLYIVNGLITGHEALLSSKYILW